ncbi:MAG TPA: hypothetical protein VF535_14710 [Allosphingosinicella sp.]|jgi:hypothetical protein
MPQDSAFLDRRTLLAGLGVGAAAAATPGLARGLAADAPAGPASWLGGTFSSLHAASLSEWRGAVGETFAVKSPNGSHELRVAAVHAFPRSGPRPSKLGRSEAFSVVFESVAGPPLPATDSLYRLRHRAYPPLAVYMSAPSGHGSLIAVFN